ncbi:MAG: hypothetical protein ABI670_00395 [Chloroflexota bacterium]
MADSATGEGLEPWQSTGEHRIDIGAQVGIMRNLEFSAGGRAHRLITGTYSSARPTLDPKSGRIHVSTASDSGDPSVGPKSSGTTQPAMTPPVSTGGAVNDGTTGDVSPARQRDKHTT